MTTTENTTPEATSADLSAENPDTTPEAVTEVTEPAESGNREAAKYRKLLRETEADRDGIAARLEAAQRHIIETTAAAIIDKPAGLWASGVQVSDLLDDDGNVDAEKVTAAATTAREELGLSKRANGPIIPNQGNAPTSSANTRSAWVGAFGGQTR